MLAGALGSDFLRFDDLSPDLPRNQVSVGFWRLRLHVPVLAQAGANGAEYHRFDFVRRHPCYDAGLRATVLQQRVRDIVSIAHAPLPRMTGSHGLAAVVENPAGEKRRRASGPQPAV